MNKKLWDEIEKVVDMSDYQPKGDHPFARLEAIQRMYIEAQNMIYVNRDGVKKWLLAESENLPRSYEELTAQKERMTYLIDAVERGYGRPKGSEQGDAMGTYVRLQLRNEHRKDFVNQGVRTAITAVLTQLNQEDDRQIGCLTLHRVFSMLEWTWRKLLMDAAGRTRKGEDQEDGSAHNHKALVACAAQIVAESAAKKAKPAEERDLKAALADAAQLRKEYADLKNMFNQLQKRSEELQKSQPYRAPYKPGPGPAGRGRGAPRGGARGGRGGWAKDTRKSNYRGGREEDNPQEDELEEKAYRVNVGQTSDKGNSLAEPKYACWEKSK